MEKRHDTRKKTPTTTDEKLDDALDDTFPASDPPSMTEPKSRIGRADKDAPAKRSPDR